METLLAEKWCDDSLKEWEVVDKEYTTLIVTPKVQGESALLRSARERRAEAKLMIAETKADLASLVQQMMRSASRGTITIEIPEAQIDVRLTWTT